MINQNNKKLFRIGSLSFNLGLIFLSSLPFFSVIFFIFSLAISFKFNLRNYLKDKNNIIFFIISIFMLFNGLVIHNLSSSNILIGWDTKLSLIGLINWIPFFICFNGFQIYLEKIEQRTKASKLLLIGSIPILITGLGQYYLGWDQTMYLFNGAIIWFIKPIDTLSGLSGLFNNPNYTSAWLSIIWPFCLLFTTKREENIFIKYGGFFLLFFYIFTLVLTNSRNGWFSILIPLPFLFGYSFLKISLIIILFLSIILISMNLNLIPLFLEEFLINLIPEKITNIAYFNINNFYLYPRLDIWRVSLSSIFMKPLFGWGAATFPFIYTVFKNHNLNDNVQHSHNLFLELSINYGLIVSSLILFNILFILLKSLSIIFYKKVSGNLQTYKSWFMATVIVLFTQVFDVTYYDVRISLLFWILIAGLKSINQEDLEVKILDSK